jgi:heme/copper-type cytochrome/quinol oxidase subunit 3
MAEQSVRRLPGPLLGMMLFISSEVMFFGSLFGAYFTVRAAAESWPPPGTPDIDVLRSGFFSLFLVASSGTQHLATIAIANGDRKGLLRWLGVTIALGAIFLAGQGLEYASLAGEGFGLDSNVFGTMFFAMTGFHGLHVAGGLVALGAVAAQAARGEPDSYLRGPVEAVSYYWHFVDVVWIALFSTLYLLR